MEKPDQPLEKFSALSIMEYIRLMTAAKCIQQDLPEHHVLFKISATDYKNVMAEELQMPLFSLKLDYDEKAELLTVTPEADFLPQYDNKIMKEVVLTFSENYKNRYKNWITWLEN